MAQPRYTNRLAQEKSPYLLQHAHNPVDWFPWSEEALAKARREDKPIFLSIGYSTCHWCHVMERESFEDPEVAAVLNTLTVPIKVDREERPDLDHVYMTVCQSLTGSGGWPLNLLLTPDREAFFAGTYFPKHSRPGRIGLVELVRQAAALWQSQRDKVVESAAGILERIRALTAGSAPEEFTPRLLSAAEDTFRGDFDPQRGGFGTAPKFPTPHNLAFLLRRYRRSSDPDLLAMVETTLEAMRRGGIYDHVGFGFHRYSTDADWLLPHFEKMLYDQAGLLSTYAEAYQATRDPGHERTLREICTYVLTTLREPEGGFHSAEDADSEGVEGKFYLWTREEILEVLGRPVGEAYCEVHGVRPEGNFRDEASGQLTGANVLHLERSLADWSTAKGIPEEVFRTRVETARHKLLQRRETRVRPHRDDKIVTGWNGLMISALSRAAWVTGDREYAAAAAGAADFLLTNLYRDGRLLRSFRQGAAAVGAFAEDYAFLARGLLDLYLPTLDSGRLVQALDLSGRLLSLFWDREHGGLFDTAEDAETLVIRPREVYDGATPSANSVALELFARLGQLTGNPLWPERARSLLAACTARVKQYPAGFTQFLQGAALVTEPTREIVIAGHSGAESTRALLAVVRNAYAPETSLLHLPDGDGREAVVRTAPFTREMRSLDGRAAAFVCQGFACRSPLTDPQELAALLRDPPSP